MNHIWIEIKKTGFLTCLKHKKVFTLIIALIPFIACMASGAPQAEFTVTGAISGNSSAYEVNEEILFDASLTQFDAGVTPDRSNRRGFNWNFGNGNRTHPNYGGVTVTQIYTKPGTYPVTLDVLDSTGQTSSITKYIQIEGHAPKLPPRTPSTNKSFELKFDSNDLSDTSPNNHTAIWNGGSIVYCDGVEHNGLSLENGYLKVNHSTTLDGFANGMAISFWVKRDAVRSTGTLLYKEGAYFVRIFQSGNQDVIQAKVHKNDGSGVLVQNYFFTDDTEWHHILINYDISTNKVSLYTDGNIQGDTKHNPQTLIGSIATKTEDIYIGCKPDGSERWTGCIDEIKIFNTTLTEAEATKGFETYHADFHARIAQRIDYFIPSDLTDNSDNILRVTLKGKSGYSETLVEKRDLQSNEYFIFKQSLLPADTYTLISQVLDNNSIELDRFEEPFVKRYDGIPHVGINEHDAICIDGVPFFPVTSFALNNASVDDWTENRINSPEDFGGTAGHSLSPVINTLKSQGNWPTNYDLAGWKEYLDIAVNHSLKVMGPNGWPVGDWAEGGRYYRRYSSPNSIAQYLQEFNNNPSLIAWGWLDEPDLGGPTQNTPSTVVRSWTFLSHYHAPEQLSYSNICGPAFVYDRSTSPSIYSYEGTNSLFGRKKHIADIMMLDYYPYDWRITRKDQNCSIAGYVEGLQKFKDENPYTPTMAFIETADIRDDAILLKNDWSRGWYEDLTPTIKPEQIRMLAWLHVALEFKGISWFNYFKDDDILISFGSVTVTNGSTTVTGSGNYYDPSMIGHDFSLDSGLDAGVYIKIASVPMEAGQTSSDTFELVSPWEGETRTTALYRIGADWANWNAMSEFTQQIEELTPVVLGPRTTHELAVTPQEGIVRTLVREHEGNIYIVAVRQTEMADPDNLNGLSIGDNVPVTNQSVTFQMPAIEGKTISVYNEDRTIVPNGNSFTDNFAECDVHIYVLSDGEPASEGEISHNQIPTAADDTPPVQQNSEGNVLDVLANDSDPDGDSLTIASVTQPARGSVLRINSNTQIRYTPDLGYVGEDTFTYTVTDGNGGTDTATVTVTVQAAESAAIPNAKIMSLDLNQTSGSEVLDSSGNGIHGTCVTSPAWTGGEGLTISGNQYVEIPDSDLLELSSAKTISAWVKLTAYTAWSKVLVKPHSEYSSPWEMYTIDLGSSGRSPRFIVTDGIANGFTAAAANSAHTLELNRWYHIAGRYDGSQIQLYLNGAEIAAAPVGFAIGTNNMPLCIGGRLGQNTMEGHISDVRIYDGAMASEPLVAVYTKGRNDSLSGHWRLDDFSQAAAADRSGNGNLAALVNSPAWGRSWAQEEFIRMTSQTQAMEVPSASLNAESGTVALWVCPESSSGLQCLVGHVMNSANRIALLTANGNLAVSLGSATVTQKDIAFLPVNQFSHVALTWDSGSYRVFVNGEEAAGGSYTGLSQLRTTFDIGNYGDPYLRSIGFVGIIEDVQTYRRALGADEVGRLFCTHEVRENRRVAFEVEGTDSLGNALSYTAQDLPAGASFDVDLQTFQWKPWYDQSGDHVVRFAAEGQSIREVVVSVQEAPLAGWYRSFLEYSGKL